MNTMAEMIDDYDQIGTSLVNGSVKDTIIYIFNKLGATIKLIERYDHKDDVDDEDQPYECWYVEQDSRDHSDYMMFRLYSDKSWGTVWG